MQKRSNDVPPAAFDRVSLPQRGRQPRTLGKCLNYYVLMRRLQNGKDRMLAGAIDFFGWDQITGIED